ncbi:ATP-binding protein [Romboutsia sp.]|uniref:ATP-binding protein n=1 Tax=Romboutsia sp. TaxID=1965302 RepID=UPI002D00CB44|nr:ATP-binding protein [Romboutsia sp.]HSQ88546.1 ATP-binding protein [Romboutsia sp.]
MNDNKIRNILLKYEQKRDQDELDLENRKKEIYTKIPEIEQIEDEISKIGLKLAKAVLLDPNSREKIVSESKEKMNQLKLRKDTLLNNYGVPSDYLEIKYSCNHCKDKGFLPSGEKCSCFKQEIINEAYKMSNLDRILSNENFANFNFDIFSPVTSDNSKISPRENMLDIFSICEKFVLEFEEDNGDNLLFYGSTGLGKTYMCNCIAKDLLDRGYVVIYQTSFRILEILEDYKFRRDPNNKLADENYKNLFDCDLLIIDDLGTELNNSFTSGEIFNIVNTRLVSGKKIIISTNLTPSQLGKVYTQRTLSRILDKFRITKFIGNDLRWERYK